MQAIELEATVEQHCIRVPETIQITYYEEDDILFIEIAKGPIVRDESSGWNINIGYTADGIGEITILDAGKIGIYPLQIERVISEVV